MFQDRSVEEVLRVIEKTSLEALTPVFKILAERVFGHRQENGGFVPMAIFPFCLAIGGGYLCAEVVLRVYGHDGRVVGYALKKRDAPGEQGWEGKYQIPGVSVRTDSPNNILDRLAREFYGEAGRRSDFPPLQFVGIEIHDEPERMAVCWTLVWQAEISEEDMGALSGEWGIFTRADNKVIVDHHQRTLAWVGEEKREMFVDLR